MVERSNTRRKYRRPAQHLLEVHFTDGRVDKIIQAIRKKELADERRASLYQTTVFRYERVRHFHIAKPPRHYELNSAYIGLTPTQCAAMFVKGFANFMGAWQNQQKKPKWANGKGGDAFWAMRPRRRYRFPPSRQVAIDCEMVGVGEGGNFNMLARVSIVNAKGEVLMDKYVKPTEPVVNYHTAVSGIEPHHIANGENFATVQKEVINILQGKLVVGHSVINDFEVLQIRHPEVNIRDTALLKPLNQFVCNGFMPSLKRLSLEILGKEIQCGEHDSVVDAATTMQIYRVLTPLWEKYYDTPQGKLAHLNRDFYKPKPQFIPPYANAYYGNFPEPHLEFL